MGNSSGEGGGGGNTGTYVALANAGLQAYSSREAAKEHNKAAKAANKPQNSYTSRTPYMNEYISKLAPYLLENQQAVFERRMKHYGGSTVDFAKIAEKLKGIDGNYGGTGGPTSAAKGGGSDPFLVGAGIRRV